MVVKTQTERLNDIRRGVMELYVSDHPLGCVTPTPANGGSELRQGRAIGRPDARSATASTAATTSSPGNGSLNFDYIAEGRVQPLFHL